jgi:hypothetical protein
MNDFFDADFGSRIFFLKKKMKRFHQKQKLQKTKYSSRIRRFTRRGGYSRLKNSLNGYF